MNIQSSLYNRSNLSALLAIMLGWALCLWPYLSGDWLMPHGTVFDFFPRTSFVTQSLLSGQWPFWSPYIYSGYPTISNPEALIYSPLLMALMLIGPSTELYWYNVVIALHMLIGGIGFYSLMRNMKFGPFASAMGAILFMLGGSAIARIQHPPQVIPYMFFPWAWLFLRCLLDHPNWRNMLALGISVGSMALHGTQVAYLCSLILLVLSVVALVGRMDRPTFVRSRIIWLVGGGIIAFIVLLPQLYGIMIFLSESLRSQIPFEIAARYNMWLPSFGTLLFPDLFGYMSGANRGGMERTMGGLYIGSIALITVAYWGIWQGLIWQRRTISFIAIGVFSIFYMISDSTPVFRYFYDWIPGVDLYRRPADASFVFNIALAGIFVAVLDQVIKGEQTKYRWTPWVGRILILLCLAGLVNILAEAIQRGDVPTILRQLADHVLWLGGAGILLALCIRDIGRMRNVVLATLFIFQLIDFRLIAFSHFTNMEPDLQRREYAFYHSSPVPADQEVLDFIYDNTDLNARNGGPFRVVVKHPTHWKHASFVHRYHSTQGGHSLRSSRYDAFAGAENEGYSVLQAPFTKIRPGFDSPATDFLSLKYIISEVDISNLDPKIDSKQWPIVKHIHNFKVYENIGVLPRVLLLTDYWEVCSATDAEDMLSNQEWPYARSAVIELPQNDCQPRNVSEPPEGKLFAKIERYENMEVSIQVESSQSALLVLNDVLVRGWKVYVDDVEQPIYRANYAFRGVKIPRGTRRVDFRYRPFDADIIWGVLTSPLR